MQLAPIATHRTTGTDFREVSTIEPPCFPLLNSSEDVVTLAMRLALIAATISSASAYAQLNTWRDDNNQLHVTESPPPSSCRSLDCKKIHAAMEQATADRELEHTRVLEKEEQDRRRQLQAERQRKEARQEEASVARSHAEMLVDAYKAGYEFGKQYRNEHNPYANGKRCVYFPYYHDRPSKTQVEWGTSWRDGCYDAFGLKPSRY